MSRQGRFVVVVALGCLAALMALYVVQLVTHVLGDPGGTFEKVATNVVFLGSGLLCLARAATVARERAAWLCFGLGLLAWGLGNLYFTLALWDLDEIPFPSWADAGYLAFYPAMFAGVVFLVRSRVASVGGTIWIDGVTAALTIAGIGAAIVMEAVLDGTGGSLTTVAVNLAYPLGDLLLLAMIAAIVIVSGWRQLGSWALIGAGLVAFGVTDSLYLLGNAEGSYVPGAWFDLGWPLCALLVAVAAWRPAALVRPKVAEGWATMVTPIGFGVASLALLVYDHFDQTNEAALALAALASLTVLVRLVMTFAENLQMIATSRHEASTDALTGLGNRRALLRELDSCVPVATSEEPVMLALFDLDGFKLYNDSFGHSAGDELLALVGGRLARAIGSNATAYRMGGDEFCVLVSADIDTAHEIVSDAAHALCEHGEGFEIGSSFGAVLIPDDARNGQEALRIADHRMYRHKSRGRTSAGRQSTDVLLKVLSERHPDLHTHLSDVSVLARTVAEQLGLSSRDQELTELAAELHDVGKVAIPDAILDKPGPLDATEWSFMKRHTVIGERIIEAAPALTDVAPIVRASHERIDGTGYPDGLAGDEIPLPARVVAVCDAYDAMRARRPYKEPLSTEEALTELRDCAGTQFDARIVDVFVAVVESREHVTSA
jgi:two-component system, cell cycle response regulator